MKDKTLQELLDEQQAIYDEYLTKLEAWAVAVSKVVDRINTSYER